MSDEAVALTAPLVLSALGVDWDVSADICITSRSVTVDEIRVCLGGQLVNGALCEDARADIEIPLMAYLEEAYNCDVFIEKGIDG